MDSMLFFQAIIALAFVIGLILLVFWLLKYCELKGGAGLLFKKLNMSGRLSVIESKRLDTKNTLVIARCDDKEYVLLLGNSQNLLLQTGKAEHHD